MIQHDFDFPVTSGEETPLLHEKPAKQMYPGVFNSCYICGINIAKLPENAYIHKQYIGSEDVTYHDLLKGVRRPRFTITYCGTCYHVYDIGT